MGRHIRLSRSARITAIFGLECITPWHRHQHRHRRKGHATDRLIPEHTGFDIAIGNETDVAIEKRE
jgi:hypothetical protein